MADRETEVLARIASGVSGLNARAWDRLAPAIRSSATPSCRRSKNRAASGPAPAGRRRRSWSRMKRRTSSLPRPPTSRATARANMCSTTAGPTPGSARAGNIIPSCRSQCRSRRCPGPRLLGVAAAAAACRARGGDAAERLFVGAHHIRRRGGRCRMRAARLADPPRRPISLVQPRLWRVRRLPRRADQPQAEGDPQGARGGARRARVPHPARSGNWPRPSGTRCGPSIRTPARANGAGPISRANSST